MNQILDSLTYTAYEHNRNLGMGHQDLCEILGFADDKAGLCAEQYESDLVKFRRSSEFFAYTCNIKAGKKHYQVAEIMGLDSDQAKKFKVVYKDDLK